MKKINCIVNKKSECSYPKCKAFLCLSFMCFVATLLAQVVVSNKFAVKGAELSYLLERQKTLEKEIYASELKISQLASLSYVEKQAAKLGFSQVSGNIVYLDSPTFALKLQ